MREQEAKYKNQWCMATYPPPTTTTTTNTSTFLLNFCDPVITIIFIFIIQANSSDTLNYKLDADFTQLACQVNDIR